MSLDMRPFRVIALVISLATLAVTAWGGVSQAGYREYATEGQVMKRVFPGARIEERTVAVTPEARRRIEALIGGRFFKKRLRFLIAGKGGRTTGYAVVSNKVGKTRDITFMVALDASGAIMSVDILVFRESRGYEVENSWWREQFTGKTVNDPLTLKRDIQGISGATLSARAVTKGVKEIVAAFEVLRPLLDE